MIDPNTPVADTPVPQTASAAPTIVEKPVQADTPVPAPVEVKPFSTADINKPAEAAKPKLVDIKKLGIQFEQRVEEIKRTGTISQQNMISVLDNYVANMAPNRPISLETGAEYQYKLWKLIENTITSAPRNEFKQMWGILLMYFNKYRDTVFDVRYVFRFATHWNDSDIYLNAFQRLVDLIRMTCDPVSAQKNSVKLNLKARFLEGLSEEAIQRISSYYIG